MMFMALACKHCLVMSMVDDVCLTKVSTVDPCSPDITPPSFSTCPDDIEVFSVGNGVFVDEWESPTATDLCAGASISSNYYPGDFFEDGTTNVVYTATDDAGNTSTCSFLVTVLPTPSTACVNNLLENPGFESDNNSITNWNLSGGTIAVSSDAFSGNNALLLSGDSYSRIEQTFSVVPGETYRVSAMIKVK